MGWSPRYKHVSQIHSDGSGWNDCFEASLLRYLYENGHYAPTYNQLIALNEVAIAARGIPDGPGNPDTDFSEADQAFEHYGIPYVWTASFAQAQAAPWSLVYVNAIKLSPNQYPPSWLGGQNTLDHFVLWLPNWKGSANWFNDPLAYANGEKDCQYTPASVADAFGGAYILPTTNHGETPVVLSRVKQKCSLKSAPSHASIGVATIPANGQFLDLHQTVVLSSETWRKVEWCSGSTGCHIGYILQRNIA